MKINIAMIQKGSMVDGPGGPRTVVWLQGCSIRCQGCQNWALWPRATSEMMSLHPVEAAEIVLDLADGQDITITGGEPFDQAEALGPFVVALKKHHLKEGIHPAPHVIIYTGYTFQYLVRISGLNSEEFGASAHAVGTYIALDFADVLVDGPYIRYLDHSWMQWRGSANQRPIDLKATKVKHASLNMANGEPAGWMEWHYEPQVLDWDTPVIEVIGGKLYGTAGLLDDFSTNYDIANRCGQAMGRVEE